MDSDLTTIEEIQLSEADMFGPPTHIICCASESGALCGHHCLGARQSDDAPIDCADCVEQDEKRLEVACWMDETKCVAFRPESRRK